MKPVDQTVLGADGNCFSACVASILELPCDEVPNFSAGAAHDAWLPAYGKWLEARGLGILCVGIHDRGLHLDNMRRICPTVPWIAGGRSPRREHAVVYVGDTFVHDPHPSRLGLISGSLEFACFILFARAHEQP